jgi:hypothetical protein
MNIPALMLTGLLFATPAVANGAQVEETYLCGNYAVAWEEDYLKSVFVMQGSLHDFVLEQCAEHPLYKVYAEIDVWAVPSEEGLKLYHDGSRKQLIKAFPPSASASKRITKEGKYRAVVRIDRKNLVVMPLAVRDEQGGIWVTEEGMHVTEIVFGFLNN